MIKLSKTTKLDGILSWSLEALETCPASVDKDGKLVPACSGCYATTGNYRFANVKAPRQFNKEDWKREGFVADFVSALENSRYFRFFDSGDMYSLQLAEKILEICKQATWVKFWIPTRMYKFDKFRKVLAEMQALPNVNVRFSSDSVTGEYVTGLHGSVIIPDADHATVEMKVCEAYKHDGKCNGCRACYDKTIPVIAYPAHGKKMAKVIKIKLAK